MVLHFLKYGYNKVKTALSRTRAAFGDKLRSLLGRKLDASALEELEQLLYEADLGVDIASELTEKIQKLYAQNPSLSSEELMSALKHELLEMLDQQTAGIATAPAGDPTVILVVGTNGNGKTTSIAKLGKRLQEGGSKVLLGAADTFRAAAIEQLDLWASQLGLDIVKGQPNGDPAAVAFDAVSAAKARQCDFVLIDTAGRLHTKKPLMQELEKIRRSCQKVCSGSPHETWLVLDATTGQNALEQAKTFHAFTPVTGLILTKLDGTAKAGIALSIQRKLHIPIKFIGVGEGADDLLPFDPHSYVDALLG